MKKRFQTGRINMQIALTFFNSCQGPVVYYSIPKDISKYKVSVLSRLMDISTDLGFFEHHSQENEIISIANQCFAIEHEAARGCQELLMLSYITDKNQKITDFKDILKKYAKIMIETPKLFKAFYVDNPKMDNGKLDKEIPEKYELLLKILSDFYKECENHAKLLEDGSVKIFGKQFDFHW
jgi:hypothetical protein